MPFRSEAQRKKFGALVKQGKISQKVFDEWNSATPKKLPKRLKPKSGPRSTDDLKSLYKERFGVK